MNRRTFLAASAGTFGVATLPPFALSQSSQASQKLPDEKIAALRSRIHSITPAERQERLSRAQEMMGSRSTDALLMEGGPTLEYFTGVRWGRSERLFAMILPRSGEPVFVGPKFEEARAKEQVGTARLLTWEEHESPYQLMKSVFGDLHMRTGTIGIEETTRYFVTEHLTGAITNISLASGTPITAGCRSVKTPHELELMQIANDITREVFSQAKSTLHEGITEHDLAQQISSLYSQYGVNGGALVLFGTNAAYPHGSIHNKSLQEGDVVLIDGGCEVEGYNSDVTRTTIFGKPSDKIQKVWEIVHKAQAAARETARPGLPSEQVDAAARKVIADGGYGPDYKYFTHRLGHGIGMEGHEWYYLVRGNTRPLEINNTFSDEPGIYIPGEFGIRLEDELHILENGARLMLPQAESLENIF